MKSRPELSAEERENLIAFLDGELDESDSQAVEARMAETPEVRQEAEALRRTWDMLDYLPRPAADESFSQQTIARLEVEKTRIERLKKQRRRLGWSAWGLAVAVAASLGFMTFYQPLPSAEELRVVANQDLFKNVDSWEFLEELSETDLFAEEIDGAQPSP